MFVSDQPIETRKDDTLGRTKFAQELGQAILSYEDKDSLTIGLMGEWGSGKSSIINMMVEYIKEEATEEQKEKTIIIKFNPWNYANQQSLIYHFFKHFAIAVEKPNASEKLKNAGKMLEYVANLSSPFVSLIPGGTFLAGIIKPALKGLSGELKSKGEKLKNDIELLREELYGLFKEIDERIVIIIDDIDRLSSQEIGQVFQLVKKLADFPNTRYVLSFDRKIVERALDKIQEDSGILYLEKIIQIPITIPHIITKKIKSKIDNVVKDLKGKTNDELWDEERSKNIIFQDSFIRLFSTCRKTNRYINYLRFTYPLVINKVNLNDYLLLCAMNIIFPKIYQRIRKNDKILLAEPNYMKHKLVTERYMNKGVAINELLKTEIEKLDRIEEIEVKKIITDLFPRIEFRTDGMIDLKDVKNEGKHEDSKRICHPNYFENYFIFNTIDTLPAGNNNKA